MQSNERTQPLFGAESRTRSNGIKVALGTRQSAADAVAEAQSELVPGPYALILAFFSVDFDPNDVLTALNSAFPTTPVSGCSTAGEIFRGVATSRSILLVGFPQSGFRVVSGLIEGVDDSRFEQTNKIAERLKSELDGDQENRLRGRVFGILLVDGLSNAEEFVLAAIQCRMNGVPLVGASAGDALNFHHTHLIHECRVIHHAAILLLIEIDTQFRTFRTQAFEPTKTQLVVTAADPERRLVYEFNAEPAAFEYANAIGLSDMLSPFSFASHPLVVKIAGDYYCRSIRNMNPDGSLTFFCAIAEGLVLTVARPHDIVRSTAETLSEIERSLGGIELVLGFECVLRRLDSENRQIVHLIEELYRHYSVVGFHTYGEQYNAMHLNQTLTGIAFGKGVHLQSPSTIP